MSNNNPSITPRPEVLQAPSTQHGALDFAELGQRGLCPDEILDFSVNSNPFGPSPHVQAALQNVPLERYPDRESLTLRGLLAEQHGITPTQIVVGNGTAEVLWLIALAYVRTGDRVLIIGPTFDEYARATALMGAQITHWNAPAKDNFAVAADTVAAQIEKLAPRFVFCCTPNNPTGSLIPPDTIRHWAARHPGTLFVIDEAYLNFAPGTPSTLTIGANNILVLRSMTKDYALAGLRLGYAAGPAPIIDALARVRPPWNVNALAQAAGVAVLEDGDYYRQTIAQLGPLKQDLVTELRQCGLQPEPSSVHYFLVNVGSGQHLRQALLPGGIQVRDCASFGLPEFVRIATRLPADNARLLHALQTYKGVSPTA